MATDVEAGNNGGTLGGGVPAKGNGGVPRRGFMHRHAGFMNNRYNNIEQQSDFNSAIGALAVVDALMIVFFYITLSSQATSADGTAVTSGSGAVSKAYVALAGFGFSFAVAALAVALAAIVNTGKHVVRGGYTFWSSFFTAISLMCAVAAICLTFRLTNTGNFKLFVCVVTIPAGLVGFMCMWIGLFTMCLPRRRAGANVGGATY